MRRFAALALCLTLGACATAGDGSASSNMYALESEYAAGLAVAAAYNDLPRCPSMINGLCSDPAKVAHLRNVVIVANRNLQAAETVVRSGGDPVSVMLAASATIADLTALTMQLRTK